MARSPHQSPSPSSRSLWIHSGVLKSVGLPPCWGRWVWLGARWVGQVPDAGPGPPLSGPGPPLSGPGPPMVGLAWWWVDSRGGPGTEVNINPSRHSGHPTTFHKSLTPSAPGQWQRQHGNSNLSRFLCTGYDQSRMLKDKKTHISFTPI